MWGVKETMTKYDLTKKQMSELRSKGHVTITRNGRTVRVTPSMGGTSIKRAGKKAESHFKNWQPHTVITRGKNTKSFVVNYHKDGADPDAWIVDSSGRKLGAVERGIVYLFTPRRGKITVPLYKELGFKTKEELWEASSDSVVGEWKKSI